MLSLKKEVNKVGTQSFQNTYVRALSSKPYSVTRRDLQSNDLNE